MYYEGKLIVTPPPTSCHRHVPTAMLSASLLSDTFTCYLLKTQHEVARAMYILNHRTNLIAPRLRPPMPLTTLTLIFRVLQLNCGIHRSFSPAGSAVISLTYDLIALLVWRKYFPVLERKLGKWVMRKACRVRGKTTINFQYIYHIAFWLLENSTNLRAPNKCQIQID